MKYSTILCIYIFLILTNGCTYSTSRNEYSVSQSENSSIELVWDISFSAKTIESDLIIDEKLKAIYLMTDNALVSLDITSGEIIWSKDRENINPLSKQLIYLQNDILIATDKRGHLVQALAAETGTLLWEKWYNHAFVSFILTDTSYLYLALGLSRGTEVIALDLYTGKQLWKAPNYLFSQTNPTGLFLENTKLFVGGTKLLSLDTATGNILETYSDNFFVRGIDKIQKEIVAYSTYNSNGDVQAFNLTYTQKEVIWRYVNNCQEGVMKILFDLKVETDVLYIGLPCHYLTKLNKQNGTVLWSTKTIRSPQDIAIIENEIFLVTTSATLLQLDAVQGEVLEKLQFMPSRRDDSGKQSIASYENKWIFVTHGNNQLFGFQKKH